MSFSYSNTPTEWSQPRLRNQVEEDSEDTGEADDIEEKPEIHEHGKITFLRQFKDEMCHVCDFSPFTWLSDIEYPYFFKTSFLSDC